MVDFFLMYIHWSSLFVMHSTMYLDKSLALCMYHPSTTQNGSTTLKILCAAPCNQSVPLQITGKHVWFFVPIFFTFSRMSYEWNYLICSIFIWLFSLNKNAFKFVLIIAWISTWLFFSHWVICLLRLCHSLLFQSPIEGYLGYF